MKRLPKILLVGAGRFGKNHLRVLLALAEDKKIELKGVVVKTKESQKEIKEKYNVPVFLKLQPDLLKSVDCVDIVTPYKTHFDLVKKSLSYAHVFVEKPIADNSKKAKELIDLAQKYKKILMVGHIFRYHPATEKVNMMLRKIPKILSVEGVFTSPIATYHKGEEAFLEELHFFDVLDFLFGRFPEKIWANGTSFLKNVSMRYLNGVDANLEIGWKGKDKIRKLIFNSSDGSKVVCDYAKSSIILVKNGREKEKVIERKEPLRLELEAFLGAVSGVVKEYPDGKVGKRIIEIIESANRALSKKQKIAVIGGGIFGTTTALILGKKFEVELFEKNKNIFEEATRANQYRHHFGYHYPRSPETIKEIQEERQDFENFYGPSIVSDFPSFYCVSKNGSNVTKGQFLKVCKDNNLPKKNAYPPKEFLNKETVNFSILTPEAVYDYNILKKYILNRLKKNRNTKMSLNSEILSVKLNANGKKILSMVTNGKKKEKEFDYIINATYARYNKFCLWLGFPLKRLNFRLKELAVVKLRTKNKCAVTIMDGPFATLVPVGKSKNLYTLGDVPLSVHKSFEGKTSLSLDEIKKLPKSRFLKMKERCLKWFPVLKDCEYVESMFVILPTETFAAKTDARPTDVVSHGFGCYSIFSGKILTAVSAAKKVLTQISTRELQ